MSTGIESQGFVSEEATIAMFEEAQARIIADEFIKELAKEPGSDLMTEAVKLKEVASRAAQRALYSYRASQNGSSDVEAING